jgi:hypothetical protein
MSSVCAVNAGRCCEGALIGQERQPHVGGALGAAWLQYCFSAGWIARIRASRAVRVSEEGRHAFRELLGFEIPRAAS